MRESKSHADRPGVVRWARWRFPVVVTAMSTAVSTAMSMAMSMAVALAVVLALALMVTGGCVSGKRQKVLHVGVLSGLDFFASTTDGFKSRLSELGYVENRSVVYDVQRTNFDPPTERRTLDRFVADKVDLILAFPTEAAMSAKAAVAGTAIPVVFAHANIEGVDLVKSVRDTGGNITGVRFPGPDLAIRRFEILNQLAPKAKRYWIPYQAHYPNVEPQLAVLRPAAAARGITLIETPIENTAELQAILARKDAAPEPGMDAILFVAEPLSVTEVNLDMLAKFALRHKLPAGGSLPTASGAGITFGVSVDIPAGGSQAAILADRIFKGTPARTIPVLSDESYFVVDCRSAATLGITVPASLLYEANKVLR